MTNRYEIQSRYTHGRYDKQYDNNDMLWRKTLAGCSIWWWKWKNVGTSCIILFSCIGGYRFSLTIVRMRTLRGRKTIIMFTIILPRRSLSLTGVRHQQLSENARQTRKGRKRCENRLVGLYSHVWTVCRKIKYTSNCLFRIAAVGK